MDERVHVSVQIALTETGADIRGLNTEKKKGKIKEKSVSKS
jgi:hypothetical protein